MLWFNFILSLKWFHLCFNLIIIYYHSEKQRKKKFKPRIKLNHNKYILFDKRDRSCVPRTAITMKFKMRINFPSLMRDGCLDFRKR